MASKKTPIKLLKHQVKPLEYIISKCKTQHGLILNHYMGTGKTITGLVFLNNFTNSKKVVILPKGFQSIWIDEAKNLKMSIKDITFITHDKLENFEKYEKIIENSICVVDEAHNLYKIIEKLNDIPLEVQKDKNKKQIEIKPRLISFIDLLYSTEKILMLSGTLIRGTRLPDLRWLINIAAGKQKSVVSFEESEFLNKLDEWVRK